MSLLRKKSLPPGEGGRLCGSPSGLCVVLWGCYLFGSLFSSGSSLGGGGGAVGGSYAVGNNGYLFNNLCGSLFSSLSVLGFVAAGYHSETCDHSERKE